MRFHYSRQGYLLCRTIYIKKYSEAGWMTVPELGDGRFPVAPAEGRCLWAAWGPASAGKTGQIASFPAKFCISRMRRAQKGIFGLHFQHVLCYNGNIFLSPKLEARYCRMSKWKLMVACWGVLLALRDLSRRWSRGVGSGSPEAMFGRIGATENRPPTIPLLIPCRDAFFRCCGSKNSLPEQIRLTRFSTATL